jgi:hypothetical protein
MQTLRSILDKLTPEEKRLLEHAFESSVPQYVEWSRGKFIGVDCQKVKNFVTEQQAGRWSAGRIINEKLNKSNLG